MTEKGDDVETLGVRKWSDLKVYVMTAFLTANNIPIAQDLRLGKDLGKNVTNEINCTGYKQKMKATRSKKRGGTSKPECIKNDGTLYCVINVMILKKEQVIIIKEAHDKDDQDSRKPKGVAFGILYADYCTIDEDLERFSPAGGNALIGYSVTESILERYDALTLDEFKEVLNFIQAVYRAARNEKNLSGNHGDFGAAVGGKVYILYLHHCLIELGDKGFESCYYPELGENTKRTSSAGRYVPLNNNRSRKSQGSTSTERSLSPYPDNDNFRSRKFSAVEATEQAAAAIVWREQERGSVEKFEVMLKMKSNAQFYEKKLSKLKRKYTQCKVDGCDEGTLVEIRDDGKYAKKMSKHYAQKYNEMKDAMNYNSPECTDDSWSDDD